MKALGYVRVSTDSQAERGISLSAQAARIRAQAKANGLRLIDIISDAGTSGKSLTRSGVCRLLADAAAGKIGAIVVWKLDRLTRSVRDLLDILDVLTKHNVRLISITESLDTETATGRMVITILAAVAQLEREQISERIRMAAQHARESGRVWGNVPWGFRRRGRNLVRNDAEVAACRYAMRLRAQGKTYQQIADALNRERKYRPRNGRHWRHQHAHRMVTRAAPRLGVKMPAHHKQAPTTATMGYRVDGPAHRRARLNVPAWRRREIAILGGLARARQVRRVYWPETRPGL